MTGSDTAVVNVGAMRAGIQENIISSEAELLMNTQTFNENVQARVMSRIERIARGKAAASGAKCNVVIEVWKSFPPSVRDGPANARTQMAFDADFDFGWSSTQGPSPEARTLDYFRGLLICR